MRQFDRVREKVEFRLDTRQIGWLVVGTLAVALGVFAAGFHLGTATAPSASGDRGSDLLASATAVAPIANVEAAETAAAPRYTYDRVLTKPEEVANIEDPVLAMKANLLEQERQQGPAVEAEAADALPADETNDVQEPGAAEENVDDAAADAQPEPVEIAPVEVAEVEAPAVAAAAPAAETPPSDAAANENGRYTIQVKAFRKKKESLQFVSALREAGYAPYVVVADIAGKGRFYRVRLGRFATMDEAEANQRAFEKAEGFTTILQTI